ncbi:MAG: chemotaxis protein CheC, partial [Verrucomicrobia bacterium]|nr:chemotaxis protein CheC [Verrucomicrobiota bacterium]
VGDIMGGAEQTMAGVFLGVEGDITASMMFLVGIDSAKRLLYKITGGMLTGEEIGEMERSAIMEVGNIITGAYLNALSMMTNMKIFPTPPQLSIDMASAILSVPATYFGMNGDQILLIQTKFFDEAEIDGYFILIPDLESYGKILSSLGISMEV